MSSLAHIARQGGDPQPDSLKGGEGLQEPKLPPKNIQGSWDEGQPPESPEACMSQCEEGGLRSWILRNMFIG